MISVVDQKMKHQLLSSVQYTVLRGREKRKGNMGMALPGCEKQGLRFIIW